VGILSVDDEPRRVKPQPDEVRQTLQAVLDALIWASGSPSFQEDGEACLGWIRIAQPAIDQARAVLAAA